MSFDGIDFVPTAFFDWCENERTTHHSNPLFFLESFEQRFFAVHLGESRFVVQNVDGRNATVVRLDHHLNQTLDEVVLSIRVCTAQLQDAVCASKHL